jgi:hypothetical protein
MGPWVRKTVGFALTLLWCALPVFAGQNPADKLKRLPRTVWNFDDGVFLQTDGSLSENTCFRLAGRVLAPEFFQNLKRVDDNQGARYLRGKEPVSEFPERLSLQFVLRDWPCGTQLHDQSTPQYLTREMMGKLKLSLFWKRGVALRPVDNFKLVYFSVKVVPPYAKELANELHERLEWSYQLDIPSAGVPLTDSLVLIFRRADGSIAARVAARL